MLCATKIISIGSVGLLKLFMIKLVTFFETRCISCIQCYAFMSFAFDAAETLNTKSTVTDVPATESPAECSAADGDAGHLVPLQLYIQGNSQSVFLLLMRKGYLLHGDVVKSLVSE